MSNQASARLDVVESVQCDAPVSRSAGGRKATDKKAVGLCVVVIHVDSCGDRWSRGLR